jgi:hypothetical protein
MGSVHPFQPSSTPRCHLSDPALVASAGQDIQSGALDLMRAVEQAQTVSEALQLYAVAETLRQALDRVATAALDMASHRCGA